MRTGETASRQARDMNQELHFPLSVFIELDLCTSETVYAEGAISSTDLPFELKATICVLVQVAVVLWSDSWEFNQAGSGMSRIHGKSRTQSV